MAPEAAVPKKYSFRQRYTKHNYSLVGGDLDDESEEDDDEPVTPAMTAAAAAGLDARALSLMEERDFAHITKGGSGKTAQYLSVRCAHNSQIGSLTPRQTTRDDNNKETNCQEENLFSPSFLFFSWRSQHKPSSPSLSPSLNEQHERRRRRLRRRRRQESYPPDVGEEPRGRAHG